MKLELTQEQIDQVIDVIFELNRSLICEPFSAWGRIETEDRVELLENILDTGTIEI